MTRLHVGIVVRWPAVEAVVSAMLAELGHLAIARVPGRTGLPDMLIRDCGVNPPAEWKGMPTIVLSGHASGVVHVGGTVRSAGTVRVGKPFSISQLESAIRLAFGRAA